MSPKNKPKPNTKRFGNLRIDEVPDVDEEEEEEADIFLGRNIFKKQKSPVNIGEHLAGMDENLIHFNALAKYYGVSGYLVKLPELAN